MSTAPSWRGQFACWEKQSQPSDRGVLVATAHFPRGVSPSGGWRLHCLPPAGTSDPAHGRNPMSHGLGGCSRAISRRWRKGGPGESNPFQDHPVLSSFPPPQDGGVAPPAMARWATPPAATSGTEQTWPKKPPEAKFPPKLSNPCQQPPAQG